LLRTSEAKDGDDEPLLLQVAAEELASDGEYSRALDPLHFRSTAWVFAHLHLERSGHVIQIGAIEEGVGQSVDSPSVTSRPSRFNAS
jgi:hypothetical protein